MSSSKPYGLLSSLADKAQGFISSHSHGSTGAPPAEGQQAAQGQPQAQGQYVAPAQEQSGTLSGRHHGLEALTHQLRSVKAQYSSGVSQENRQLQLMINAQKGVSLDFDAAGRDAKSQSKELFLWGQVQDDGIKDVTDRLAYLNYIQGALSYTLATEIDKSRTTWKHVRDAEAAIAPRRTIRQNLKNEMTRIQASGGRTGNIDVKLQQLEAQLRKVETDDAPLEKELDLLRRAAIKESEAIKWKAFRDYGNKLVLLTGAAEQLLNLLPSAPGLYHGQQQTAAVRAALQRALDSGHTPPTEQLPINIGSVSADDKKSFGETHAHELSQISSAADSGHHTPKPSVSTHSDTHPIDPAVLNNTPASIPPSSMNPNPKTYSPPATSAPLPVSPPKSYAPPMGAPKSYAPPSTPPPGESIPYTAPAAVPASQGNVPHAPTVAETGVPVSAGGKGPGPAQGPLAYDGGEKDESVPRPAIGYGVGTGDIGPPTHVTAASQEANIHASGSVGRPAETRHESAEDEKRRLEREERERVLRADTYDKDKVSGDETGDIGPPAYIGPNASSQEANLHASGSVRRPAETRHESAEDEKKRLEREERERVLRADTYDDKDKASADTPPAYTG